MAERETELDPIVRCMSCSQLIIVDSIKKTGCCPKCGNKRVTDARMLTKEEMNKLKEKGGFEDFLKLFEEVDDDGIL